MDEITVKAPATVSNVVCGFDCLGFAISEPYDLVTVRNIDEAIVRIAHLDDFALPTDPDQNVAGVALDALITEAGSRHGFEVTIEKRIKPGSGIGSSAASSCGAIAAANLLLGEPFQNAELVRFAMEGEKLASGSAHADNVAPCLLGGFTLVRSVDPLDIISLEYPRLFAAVVHPQIEIKTSEARAMLPENIPLKKAVRNWSNLGAFVSALSTGDLELLGRSMVDDIVEPVRRSLIPHYEEIKAACMDAGALGGGISGSGPSIFMLNSDRDTADRVAREMQEVFCKTTIGANIYVSEISPVGVQPA